MDGIKYYDHNWNEIETPDESQEIEYVPVVHGHWITRVAEVWKKDGSKADIKVYADYCSECGSFGTKELDNFCSNCGARMVDDE